MGFLTTFTVYNDGCDQFKEHPERLAEIIYEGCLGVFHNERRGLDNQVGLGNHLNLITVQRPRHADSHTLYLHAGNTVIDVQDIRDKDDRMLNTAIHELEYELKRLKALKKKS